MNEATRQFIALHAEDDVRKLALQSARQTEVDMPFALRQISGRQAARKKLPSWAVVDGIVYPPHLSMEQCSSEPTARYKAQLAGTGKRFVDLTGGFGVDFSFMSPSFQERIYVEKNAELCAVSSENFPLLGLDAVVVHADGTDYLKGMEPADVVFIDPARRDMSGSRTYGIADCTPNVLEMLNELMQRSRRVILKLSPMLDWHKAVADIESVCSAQTNTATTCSSVVREVHVVSVMNECKELLLVLSAEEPAKPQRLVCVNLKTSSSKKGDETFEVLLSQGVEKGSSHAGSQNLEHWKALKDAPDTPSVFLYEPNASIMKAGCFRLLEQRYGVEAVGTHSHLFVADRLVADFPGRIFRIHAVSSMNKKEISTCFRGISQANITVRNFPTGVAQLRKRLKLKEGGDDYVFATTLAEGTHVLIITKKVV